MEVGRPRRRLAPGSEQDGVGRLDDALGDDGISSESVLKALAGIKLKLLRDVVEALDAPTISVEAEDLGGFQEILDPERGEKEPLDGPSLGWVGGLIGPGVRIPVKPTNHSG